MGWGGVIEEGREGYVTCLYTVNLIKLLRKKFSVVA